MDQQGYEMGVCTKDMERVYMDHVWSQNLLRAL